ncbi:hypothetical protein AAVH_27312 [Aphelenchoides avenae]|nr:hypothetical protein AAVH_27312 [Aphelenchus avenae]
MSALALNITSVLVYIASRFVHRRPQPGTAKLGAESFVSLPKDQWREHIESTDRIYKSLCIIVAFDFFDWRSNSLYMQLREWRVINEYTLEMGEMDEYTLWCSEQALGYLLVVATAVNAPRLVHFQSSVPRQIAFVASAFEIVEHKKLQQTPKNTLASNGSQFVAAHSCDRRRGQTASSTDRSTKSLDSSAVFRSGITESPCGCEAAVLEDRREIKQGLPDAYKWKNTSFRCCLTDLCNDDRDA